MREGGRGVGGGRKGRRATEHVANLFEIVSEARDFVVVDARQYISLCDLS